MINPNKFGMISASDLDLIYATDSVEEAIAHIRSKAIEPFGGSNGICRGWESAGCLRTPLDSCHDISSFIVPSSSWGDLHLRGLLQG